MMKIAKENAMEGVIALPIGSKFSSHTQKPGANTYHTSGREDNIPCQ